MHRQHTRCLQICGRGGLLLTHTACTMCHHHTHLCRFVEYAEDRSTRESQRFWFSVMDADGDGRLSWADMKLLWMAVERSCSGGMLLHFEDLMNQIRLVKRGGTWGRRGGRYGQGLQLLTSRLRVTTPWRHTSLKTAMN